MASQSDESESSESRTPHLSIGAVAQAAGIPVETLRTWERRYGFPSPDRSESGHRTYDPSIIEHLRWVVRATQHGHRPSAVLRLDLRDLRELVRQSEPERETPNPPVPSVARPDEPHEEPRDAIEAWLAAVERLDEHELHRQMIFSWNALGTLRFINQRVAPFLDEVGDAWASGRLTVSHEHFASERVRDFLSDIWRPLSEHSDGPVVVCTTLPGEHHHLGALMAACVLTIASHRVVYLGPNTPLSDISGVARQADATAVAVSVSLAMDAATARKLLQTLAAALPADAELLVGGAGAPDPREDSWSTPATLDDLWAWARARAGDLW